FQVLSFNGQSGAFATVSGLTLGYHTLFTTALSSTSLVLTAQVSASDLALTSTDLSVPATGTPGQPMSIPYTVHNLAGTAAAGDWYDSFYLSTATTLDASAVLLGRVHHLTGVAGNGMYSDTLTATVAGLPDGNYYLIAVTDSRGQVPDPNRANNT